jgi:hypothetical protein
VAYAGTTITITEHDCIGVVFSTAAEKYHYVLTSEQRTKGASLTMDDLEDVMTSDDGGEIFIAAFGGI